MSTRNPTHHTDQSTPSDAREQAYERAQNTLRAAKAEVAEYQQKLDSARNAADRVRYKDHLDRAIEQEAAAQTKVTAAENALID